MIELPIPLIDLQSDPRRAAQELHDACTQHGFFFVTNHGVPDEARDKLFQESQHFFSLPEEVKLQSEAIGNRGYTALGEQTLDPTKQKKGDTKESFYISKPEAAAGSPEAKLPFHGPNRWPAAAPGFRPAMENYMECIRTAQQKVLHLMADALGLPDGFFDSSFSDPILTLRPIHYTAEQSDTSGGVFGAGAHTDWGFCTFVETNCTPGLQVLYEGEWRAVPCLPGALVVNIGDLLETWTNGVFKSTLHRVVNCTPGKERYSCAYFVSPNYDTQIECLPTCLADGPKFKSVTCHEYLNSKYGATHSRFTHAAAA